MLPDFKTKIFWYLRKTIPVEHETENISDNTSIW
jgi:hypothetical protein